MICFEILTDNFELSKIIVSRVCILFSFEQKPFYLNSTLPETKSFLRAHCWNEVPTKTNGSVLSRWYNVMLPHRICHTVYSFSVLLRKPIYKKKAKITDLCTVQYLTAWESYCMYALERFSMLLHSCLTTVVTILVSAVPRNGKAQVTNPVQWMCAYRDRPCNSNARIIAAKNIDCCGITFPDMYFSSPPPVSLLVADFSVPVSESPLRELTSCSSINNAKINL